MARVLVVFRRAPASGPAPVETRDLALAALAFEHSVDALFLGDGVLQLLPGQAGAGPDTLPGLRALLHHGLRAAHVLDEDLAARGLDADRLGMPVSVLARAGLPALLADCTHCFGEA